MWIDTNKFKTQICFSRHTVGRGHLLIFGSPSRATVWSLASISSIFDFGLEVFVKKTFFRALFSSFFYSCSYELYAVHGACFHGEFWTWQQQVRAGPCGRSGCRGHQKPSVRFEIDLLDTHTNYKLSSIAIKLIILITLMLIDEKSTCNPNEKAS